METGASVRLRPRVVTQSGVGWESSRFLPLRGGSEFRLQNMRKTGRILKVMPSTASSRRARMEEVLTQVQPPLLRGQVAEPRRLRGGVQKGVRPQQHCGVGTQRQAPRQAQAVEKHLAQAQLVFLVGLRGLNPRSHALEQGLGGSAGPRQQPQQTFMVAGGISELARTLRGLPTPAAQRRGDGTGYPEPMPVLRGHIPGASKRPSGSGRIAAWLRP